MSKTFWVVCDRRVSKEQIISDIIGGEPPSTYFQPDAARKAVYPTERVLEITIIANDDK